CTFFYICTVRSFWRRCAFARAKTPILGYNVRMPDLIDQSIESRSPAQTEELAIALAQTLSGGTVIRLSGELGAGKTVFVRRLAKGLKMPPGVALPRPAYVLQHAFRGGRLNLYHIDAYRMM